MLKVGFFTNSIILLSFGFSMPLARRVSQPELGKVKSMAWTEKVDIGDLQWSGIKLSHELSQVIKSVCSTISALNVPALRLAALGSPPRGNCLRGSEAPLFQPRERLSWMAEWTWFEDFWCRFTSWSGFHMIVNVSQRVLLNFRDVIGFLLGSDGTETHWNVYYCAVASWWAIVFFSFLAERSCSVTGWRLSTIVIRCNHKHVNLRDSRIVVIIVLTWDQ